MPIQLTAADGHEFSAYENRPDGATASIVIIQEIFGVNEHIRNVVDRYAGFGYHAIAPAIFDRVQRDVELNYDPDGIGEGRALAGKVDWDQMMSDVASSIEHASSTGPFGLVGYCFGGSVAWASSSDLPVQAAVGYYGGMVHGMIDKTPAAPVMLHFGALDPNIPLDGVNEVAAAHPNVPVHIYDEADHGFNCDARGSYHAASAALAQERTLEFLAANGVAP